jgi:hemolysin activation/secretion protein
LRLLVGAVAGVLCLSAVPAAAQSSFEPAAIERTIPGQISATSNVPSVVFQAREPMYAQATGRFTLGAVNIDGATVFSKKELTAYFEPLLASDVDASKLSQMADRITERYRQTGYLLSYATVPTQDVQAGMVRLAIVEGRIGNIIVKGAGADQLAVEAIAAPLLAHTPLRASTLERTIGLVRDFPGLRVIDATLARSGSDSALYDLKITVARDRARAFTYMDNRGSDETGRLRIFSSASLSSVAIQGDEVRLDLFGMPGRRFRYVYGQLHASVPLGPSGWRLAIAASKGDHQLRSAEPADGDSTNLSAQLSYPVVRSRALTMVTKFSLNDWRSSGDQDQILTLRDRLRVARIGLEVSNESKTRLQGEFSLSRGLGFDKMTKVGDPRASRPDASGRFTKAAVNLQVTRPLSDKVNLKTVLSGQYSDRPLLSAEEFALGGTRIGRAFSFNALTGDRGVGGGAEVSYRLSDSKRGVSNVELFGFVDGGMVFEAKSAAATDRRRSLASAGMGARFRLLGTAISAEAGVPLAADGPHKSVNLFFSTTKSF